MKLLLCITHFLPADVRLFTLHRAYFAQNYNFLKEQCHGDSCAVTCTWVSRHWRDLLENSLYNSRQSLKADSKDNGSKNVCIHSISHEEEDL